MKVTQVLALFAVLAVTVSACGDKNKHPHDPQDSEPEVPAPDVPTPDVPAPQNPIPQDPQGSVSGSKTQHQEANNNGAEITNSEGLANLNNVAKDAVNVASSKEQNIQINQSQSQ